MNPESVDLIVTDPPYGYSFMGKDWDKAVPSVEIWQECLRVLKPGAFAFVMSAPRQDVLSQMIVRLDMAGFDTGFTSIYWTYASGFPKAANISKLVDKRLGVEPLEVKPASGVGFMKPNSEDWHQTKNQVVMPEATTPQAKALDGSYAGFQPKPAVEVIIVAMKPLSEKTYVDQALANGKGITWLDDCRIPYQNEDDSNEATNNAKGRSDRLDASCDMYSGGYGERTGIINPQGRFPANLLVSDDVLNDGRITKSPSGYVNRKPKTSAVFNTQSCGFDDTQNHNSGYGDSGSYSRYFDLDKWAEKTLPFLIVPKASKSEKDRGLENEPDRIGGGMQGTQDQSLLTGSGNIRNNIMKNNHPTVKPLKLMSYLITMGSRPNDIVLDPFSGSGTTCVAAKQLGRQYLGIELSEEYATIARKRLEAVGDSSQAKLIP